MEEKELSAEEIAALKKKYGEISKFVVDNGKWCILRKPGRTDVIYAEAAGDMFSLVYVERIVNNCFVAGDENFKTDVSLLIAMKYHIINLLNIKSAELVKL